MWMICFVVCVTWLYIWAWFWTKEKKNLILNVDYMHACRMKCVNYLFWNRIVQFCSRVWTIWVQSVKHFTCAWSRLSETIILWIIAFNYLNLNKYMLVQIVRMCAVIYSTKFTRLVINSKLLWRSKTRDGNFPKKTGSPPRSIPNKAGLE